MPGTPPFPRRCASAATNECAGAVDAFLSNSGVASGRLNGTQGNGFDDDCDGVVDEGCSCTNVGVTKDCFLVPATQADATSQPVGWCRSYAKGTMECVGGSGSQWSGLCRGALSPRETDSCAPGDFDCDGLSANDPTQGCTCGAPVACPTMPLTLAPYPNPSSLTGIDGTQWITDPAQRPLAQNWTWTVIGGDCDNVLPFPTFALYSQAASSSTARLGTRTAVRFDSAASPPRYVASTGAPIISIRGTSSRGTVYPAFGLSGDYVVQGEFTLNGTVYACSQRVEVRAPGIRAELCWDTVGGTGLGGGNDLDLHFARLQNTCTTPQGWNELCSATGLQDCYYNAPSGCRETSTTGPRWGYADSTSTACLGWSSRRVAGTQGCTNPRLDRDNISCDRTVADPTTNNFCGPENINLDAPNDLDGFVVGVNHYGTSSGSANAKPHVNVYCNGRRVLSSGANPATAEQWPLLRTAGSDTTGDFWTVALLRAHVSGGQLSSCDVTPIPSRHADPSRDGVVSAVGAGNGFCVDSFSNQSPAPDQFNATSRRFIDNATTQGGAIGTRPMQTNQWCKH